MNTPATEKNTGHTPDIISLGVVELINLRNVPFILVAMLFLLIATPTDAQLFKNGDGLAHTYSIVARDEKTGDMAVGVQSHWFGVGTSVSWAEAGVGAIATQSLVQESFGIRGLALLKAGKTAQEALDILLSDDPNSEMRQVGIVDSKGNVANFTGKKCMAFAGEVRGRNYSVQSNMMETDQVPAAMSQAFEANPNLPLAERVLAAMKAAQKAGGDIRGQQSAAILVVRGQATGKPWDDNHLVDLRVDDHPKAMAEMERLLRTFRAYEQMDNGYAALENNDRDSAMRMFEAAMKLSPDNLEIRYWAAIEAANGGDVKRAASLLDGIYAKEPVWRELTKRVHKAGILKVEASDLKTLVK
jgi:uncharacterized Ntn-hydrolase superfamily protein